ncbi:MAG TPA: glucose-1-phosphate cytidylyltransferase [Candidatus Paceibacterota bacterium]|nr:glucose-1-phosphate cytidylyltransferase [Candidatus Paceibacterota bacterium]
MKVVILAGGLGTRISEETQVRPKPMVEIGGMPLLWHIMKIYSFFEIHEFVICLGYKGEYIKDWFLRYKSLQNSFTLDLERDAIEYHTTTHEPWKIALIDTGLHTMTAGRIARIREYVGNEPFMLTYGDGVANVNIHELLAHHKSHGKLVTMTTIVPEGRYGVPDIGADNIIASFSEKTDNRSRVNGGFFVCEPAVFDYLQNSDSVMFERGPLDALARDGQLVSYPHDGFWKAMDTLGDKQELERLWAGGAPWKVWDAK